MKKYKLTDEHRSKLKPWADKWIGHAMSTDPIDEERTSRAVIGMYASAGLPAPRVVIVPSPFVAAFAYGAASAILRKDATRAATRDATEVATRDATGVATEVATRAATVDATRVATGDATEVATEAATWHNSGACAAACRALAGNPGIRAAGKGYLALNSGNQWAGYAAYLSFFRHVARLPIDYSKWAHYETLAECSGPRYMHPEFCIVSDRPRVLLVDDDNEPHCDDGPFCEWRDGTRLYAVHGHRVPEWIIETPERITLEAIHAEENAETRRVMRERYGEGRYLQDTGAVVLDADTVPIDALNPRGQHITRALMEDKDGQRWLVGSDGSTPRVYYMRTTKATCAEAYVELRATTGTLTTIMQS